MERQRLKLLRRGAIPVSRGAAVVEMAVVTPILLTLVFGIIEFSWYMSSQETLTNAAREGCRTAVIQGTTDQQIRDRITSYLTAAGLSGTTIELQRSTAQDPTETVRLSLPYSQISLLGSCGSFFPSLSSKMLRAACSMRKEGA
jgi:Flp pilus assembly protein TadG